MWKSERAALVFEATRSLVSRCYSFTEFAYIGLRN
jgi:hypothetical protein